MLKLFENVKVNFQFQGLKKPSAFVAGVVDKDLTTIGLLNILSQPGSIALSFENSKDEVLIFCHSIFIFSSLFYFG